MYRGFNLDTLSVSKGNSGWNQSVVKVGCHLCSHNHKTLVKTFASTKLSSSKKMGTSRTDPQGP